jgi:diadenylate cyclase
MLARLARIVGDALGAIRLADILDIVVVAAFVYATIAWVRRARSRFVLLGFATLVAVYFVARLLDMYLTLFLFQAGITVALLALVVIFQEEIRRAFERIATGGLLRSVRQSSHAHREIVDPIVEAAKLLSQARTGALIVLRGKEPLERHTTGGVLLEGRLSTQLLCSIFDPGSPGHDGAVVIEDGLVSRFGIHLPLSTRIKEGAPLGTRHTAALGLSERSDALIVVISEERGTISVARAGILRELGSLAELKQILSDFLAETAPTPGARGWRRLFAPDLGAKVVSLLIAVLAWLLVFGQQTETIARTFDVPIVYRDIPEGWLLDDPDPLSAHVTISGRSRAFGSIDAGALRLSIDATNIKPGRQVIKLTPAHLDIPQGLTVHEIDPGSASVTAHQTIAKNLPVRPDPVGRLPAGLVLKNVSARPAQLRVMVANKSQGSVNELHTEPIDLSEVRATSVLPRAVILPRGSRLARGEPSEVQVTLAVEPGP